MLVICGMFRDLREFIEGLEEIGETKRVEGADPHLEIGAITELIAEQKGPALLFDKVKGYPAGYRIASNLFFGTKRTALALGLIPESSGIEIIEWLRDRLKKYKPKPPAQVKNGYVKENIHIGKDVNLFEFPTPQWHEQDGGRYIGTGDIFITRDLDTGWINLGTYRVQIHNKNTAGLHISPYHHGRLIMEKYWAKGLSCPVAVACGQDPIVFVAANLPVPWGVSEYDLAGWLKNEPIKVVKGETTDLPIPSTAEIVIEGEVPPPEVETKIEGPFGEYTGYYGSGAKLEPVIRVKSILHRDDPILQGNPPLKPNLGGGGGFSEPIMNVPTVWNELERAGVPEVKGVWASLIGSEHVMIVAIHQRYAGHALQAGLIASGCIPGEGRWVIVVDDDIDPSNTSEILWALGTRCDPETSINIIKGCWSDPLDPRLSPDKRDKGDFTSSKVIVDACKPYHWIKDFPAVCEVSGNLKEKIMKKWSSLFKE